ncbi:MAG: hypothetical protein IJR85_03285 [Synergistaceae bacterium]|nr:hypothetical protein [Synergistaceae bacterium]
MCKLCGKIFDPFSVLGDRGICNKCYARLDEMYSKVHKYIRDNSDEERFRPANIAEATGISLDNIKLLFSMGYIERDMQTWSKVPSERAILAKKFERELRYLIEKYKLTTYGGKIYKRNSGEDIIRTTYRHSESVAT